MFDADTVALIAAAPPLEGLDLADLPRRFTNAYVSIVSARVRLRETTAGAVPEDVRSVVAEMRRLAATHEALVSILSDRENRSAAAFVAGTAHYVSLLAQAMEATSHRPSRLDFQAVSPEVAATVLFLVAEASADAAEMAKLINVASDEPVERAVLVSIRNLANGQLLPILQMSVPSPDQILAADDGNQGVRALYFLIFHGIRAMAANLLGMPDGIDLLDSDPSVLFRRVKELSIGTPTELLEPEHANSHFSYAGPLHLASLLLAAWRDLPSSSSVNVQPPNGVDGGRWANAMMEMAERRPYLWRNHRQAIEAGYLEPGTSSVVSFPTGAGKSTLSELKIATALLRGTKVLFLAPTLALVDQTARALKAAFPAAEVQRERAEELLFDFDTDVLPAISVMTPERCLTLISFDREALSDVGLLVFDECHLLHPRDLDRSRRALDAMLCVLNFTTIAPNADLLLLSAMMMNGAEIARWLEELTGRTCLPLAFSWKPTRQVRGCVVYGAAEIQSLREKLRIVRAKVSNKNPPAETKRDLAVQPFGFFCLRQTWQSTSRDDYALLPLLNAKVVLATGTAKDRSWYLTPNGNQVAVAIAVATAYQRLKTLIFTQTIPLANSAVHLLCQQLGPANRKLTSEESHLYSAIVDELGGIDRPYIEVKNGSELVSTSVCHHGLLLPAERQLHESLFRRADGVNVIVATSTLAQGMNLPSEVVIIAGDSRFDPNANKLERLEAHELLNAAGRAGRAGDGSFGFVLVVPSKVVHFDNAAGTIHQHWADLRAIFAQSDQCLVIDDPLTALLDQIQLSSSSTLVSYFLRRLPMGGEAGDDDKDAAARKLLDRSFAAYRARARDDKAWVQSRVEAAIAMRQADPEIPDTVTWIERLAAAAGVPVNIVRELSVPLGGPLRMEASVVEWRDWVTAWLKERAHWIPMLIRRENLEGLLGAAYKDLQSDADRGSYAFPFLSTLLQAWMAGGSLVDIEKAFGTPDARLGNCEKAREFVVRVVPELAYIYGLPAQIIKARTVESDMGQAEPPLGLGVLGPCVREGLDDVWKLALRQHYKGRVFRRALHREFETIKGDLGAVPANESWSAMVARVQKALLAISRGR